MSSPWIFSPFGKKWDGNGDSKSAIQEEVESFFSIVGYSTCSISMILLNKLVIDTYGLDYPMGLLCLQNLAAVLLVVIGKLSGLIYYPDFEKRVAFRFLPLTVFFVCMLWTSMKSLKLMSVAAQTIIKNLAIIFTALGDAHFNGKTLTLGTFGAFGLMIFGSYLGTSNDRWVTEWGLFWTFCNIAATVSYVLYMKTILKNVSGEIGRYGPVFYGNLLSLPFLSIPAAGTLPNLVADISQASPAALGCVTCMLLVGSVMTFASFWCMKMTSPTTYSVVGALNKVPLAFLGIWIFGHYPSPMGYTGIACALSGGFVYAYISSRQGNGGGKPATPTFPSDAKLEEGRRIV